MLLLCKILRLFVYTLTDDEKYCSLYRDNLTQPIQILLAQKQKTFSRLISAFLKSTLNFARFQKKDDTHSRYISQITVSEKGDSRKSVRSRFKGLFHKKRGKRAKRHLKSA